MLKRLMRRMTLKRTLDDDWRLFRCYDYMGAAIAAGTIKELPPAVQRDWKDLVQWVYDYLYGGFFNGRL
jgi:hypothetical protein